MGVGAYGGYGITGNLKTNEVIMGPQIGFGVTYNIIKW